MEAKGKKGEKSLRVGRGSRKRWLVWPTHSEGKNRTIFQSSALRTEESKADRTPKDASQKTTGKANAISGGGDLMNTKGKTLWGGSQSQAAIELRK